MKTQIISRIKQILATENSSSMRWRSDWFSPDLEYVGVSTKREIKEKQLIHISQILWEKVPDDKLLVLFEMIIRQSNRQFG